MYEVDVENGKYTFINDNGIVSIKRCGEEWQENVGGKALLCLLQHVEKLELELKQCKELSGAVEVEETAGGGELAFHDTYKKTITMGAMKEYAHAYGKEIHEHGTHGLVTYDTEVDEDCLYLTLDFEDDHRTPKFYVTRMEDNDLESHATIQEAIQDFASRLVNENQVAETYVVNQFGAWFFE